MRYILLVLAVTVLPCRANIFTIDFDVFFTTWTAQPILPGPAIGVSMPLCYGDLGAQTCMFDPDWTIPNHRQWTAADAGFSEIAAYLTNGANDHLYFREVWGKWESGTHYLVRSGDWEYSRFGGHDLAGYVINSISRDMTNVEWSYANNEWRFAATGSLTFDATPNAPTMAVADGGYSLAMLIAPLAALCAWRHRRTLHA